MNRTGGRRGGINKRSWFPGRPHTKDTLPTYEETKAFKRVKKKRKKKRIMVEISGRKEGTGSVYE